VTGESSVRLHDHRRIWEGKPVLAEVYRPWFEALLAEILPGAPVLELGAGPGFLSGYARQARPDARWLATDLLETPWNDLVADGLRLPFAAERFDALAGLDVIHHLARPRAFFEEAGRVLRPGGRAVFVEPWVTPLSYPIYRFFHQEGCTLGLDPWNPFALAPGARKEAFEGDAAVVWRLVRDTPSEVWRSLGFCPPRTRALNGFAYLLSLGFRDASLLPSVAAPLFLAVDTWLGSAAGLLGLRVLAVWEKLGAAPSRHEEDEHRKGEAQREPASPPKRGREIAALDLVASGRQRDRAEDAVRPQQRDGPPVDRGVPAGSVRVEDHEVAGV
jgi:SAM-dependent methyltransferase